MSVRGFIMYSMRHNIVVLLLMIFIFAFLLRLPGAIISPSQIIYTFDERNIINSSVLLITGQLPPSLNTPASTIIFPLMGFNIIDLFISQPQFTKSIMKLDIEGIIKNLSFYITKVFYHPHRHLILGRILVAFIASLAPVFLFLLARHIIGFMASLVSCLIFASSPIFVYQSYNVQSDAMALTFLTMALYYSIIKMPQKRTIFVFAVTGVLLGLTLASKFFYGIFIIVPIIEALRIKLSMKTDKIFSFWNFLSIYLLATILVVILFVPFILVAPLTLLKSCFQPLMLAKTGNSWGVMIKFVLPSFIGWFGILFSSVGALLSFTLLAPFDAALLLFTPLLFILLICSTSTLHNAPRHLLPILPFICIYVGISAEFIIRKVKKVNYNIVVIFLMISSILIPNLFQTWRIFYHTHNLRYNKVFEWIDSYVESGKKIALPAELELLLKPDYNSLRHILRYYKGYKSTLRVYKKVDTLANPLTKRHLSLEYFYVSPLSIAIFGEDERFNSFLIETVLWSLKHGFNPGKSHDIRLYYIQKPFPTVPGYLDINDVTKMFSNKEIDVMLSHLAIREIETFLIKSFYLDYNNQIFIYMHDSGTSISNNR